MQKTVHCGVWLLRFRTARKALKQCDIKEQDMAGVALFLASPLSSYVIGQTIIVDGGLIL